jgi:alcohol dehydrogenase
MGSQFSNPTRRLLADGALAQIRGEIAAYNPKRVLLVLGKQSFRNSLYYNNLCGYLEGLSIQKLEGIPNNPTASYVQEQWDKLRDKTFDVVIGVGGGSVLDFGKTVAALLTQTAGKIDDYLAKRVGFEQKPLPFVAIPTTAGTGSEVTPYASIESKDKQKISLAHPYLFPAIAIVDPTLTYSMPAYLTACTGFDAICQAIESYWSKSNTSQSQTHSLRAIPVLLSAIRRAITKPDDVTARYEMAYASSEAGIAISETKTTAVHSVSYPMTTHFGVAHGHACALTLSSFIRFNAPALKGDRGNRLYQRMGTSSADNAANLIDHLMNEVQLERTLTKVGIDQTGINTVVEHGFRTDRVKNNPRDLTPDELRELLMKLQ